MKDYVNVQAKVATKEETTKVPFLCTNGAFMVLFGLITYVTFFYGG